MEIPVTIIVYSGQDQQQVIADVFGYYTKPEEPDLLYPNVTHEFDGGKIKYKNSYAREAIGLPQDTNIIIEITKDIAVGIISTYIYDKLSKQKNAKIRFGKKEINIIKDEIHKAIKEEFDKQKTNE